MADIICQISPDLVQSGSKIGNTIAFGDKYLAFVVDGVKLKVVKYEMSPGSFANQELNMHHEPIKCVRFSKNSSSSPVRLLSCSGDSVLLWNLNDIFQLGLTSSTNARLLVKNYFKYEITSCSFHPNDRLVAVSNGINLTLIDVNVCAVVSELNLTECINTFDFSLFADGMVFVSTHLNSLFVYDYRTGNELQELTCDSARSSFIYICGVDDEPIVVLSSSDGWVYLYEFLNGRFFNIKKVKPGADFDSDSSSADHELCVGLHVLGETKTIAYACLNRVYLIDLYSFNLVHSFDYSCLNSDPNQYMPQSVEFSPAPNGNVCAAVLSIFKNEITIVKLKFKRAIVSKSTPPQIVSTAKEQEHLLTVFAKLELSADSPLNEKIHLQKSQSAKQQKSSKPLSMHEYLKTNGSANGRRDSLNKPLTFASRIKSSGYNAAAPKRERFLPSINKSKSTASLSDVTFTKPSASKSKKKSEPTEFEFVLPSKLKGKHSPTDKNSPAVEIKFTNDGAHFVLSSSDNVVQYVSASNLDKTVAAFSSHTDVIRSVDVSHDGRWLVSAGDDRTCKIWSLKGAHKLMLDVKSADMEFKKPISAANFFYLDKFLLIGTEKQLLLCKYHIDTSKCDIQTYANDSSCKLVRRFEMTFAQSIVCMSVINSFFSYVVLCGGTNKSIEVFDLNECKSSLTIHDAHMRPFNQIYQNQSEFNRVSYDLFLTNGVCDGVKVWDLRSAKCVRRFDAHLNRYLPTKVSLSADSIYVSACSEDRFTYVYDARMNNEPVLKYGPFNDSPVCAMFNPRKSQLLCSTLDGKVYNYQD